MTTPTRGLLSGTASLIVGAIGMAALAAAAFIPSPWGALVGLVGFLAAAVAGFAAPPPAFTAGRPMLQGAALSIATTLGLGLEQWWAVIPDAWRPVALGVAGLLAWLTGRAMPALGAKEGPVVDGSVVPPAEPVKTLDAAADTFNRKGPQP